MVSNHHITHIGIGVGVSLFFVFICIIRACCIARNNEEDVIIDGRRQTISESFDMEKSYKSPKFINGSKIIIEESPRYQADIISE